MSNGMASHTRLGTKAAVAVGLKTQGIVISPEP
jgi:hypothetical protein